MKNGMRVGDERISSSNQKLDLQLERLSDCDRIFHEKLRENLQIIVPKF
jgi:hypothetical protein